MPKPSFIQSVLRKPSRSYADPYASSPWAESNDYDEVDFDQDQSYNEDYRPSSRYSSRSDQGVHFGYSDRPLPGPSGLRVAQAPNSALSTVSESQSASATRFPRPVKKSASTIALRDGVLVNVTEDLAKKGTVKKKKKKAVTVDDGLSVTSSRVASPIPTSGTVRRKKKPTRAADEESMMSGSTRLSDPSLPLHRPPSLQRDASSSTTSSPIPPVSPVSSQVRNVAPQKRPPPLALQQLSQISPGVPLTPPTSESSGNSLPPFKTSPRRVPPPDIASAAPVSSKRVDAEELFTSPLGSTHRVTAEPDEVELTPRPVEPPTPRPPVLITPRAAADTPTFVFQPPTPAPLPNPDESPFHSEPSSTSSLSLHPDRPVRTTSPLASPLHTRSPHEVDDTQSDSGQVGSDEDEAGERRGLESSTPSRGRHTNMSKSRSSSRDNSRSRPASVVRSGASAPSEGRVSVSRSSTSMWTRRGFDDFRVIRRDSMPTSEPPRRAHGRAESVVSSGSGYGKGGWAAAQAERDRAPTPVMFMPSDSLDGWASFHQPPPKVSRYTPLPPASQPVTFDRLVRETHTPGHSVASFAPGGPEASGESSSVSEYSRHSDGTPLPKPSRSYAPQDYESEGSRVSLNRERPAPTPATVARNTPKVEVEDEEEGGQSIWDVQRKQKDLEDGERSIWDIQRLHSPAPSRPSSPTRSLQQLPPALATVMTNDPPPRPARRPPSPVPPPLPVKDEVSPVKTALPPIYTQSYSASEDGRPSPTSSRPLSPPPGHRSVNPVMPAQLSSPSSSPQSYSRPTSPMHPPRPSSSLSRSRHYSSDAPSIPPLPFEENRSSVSRGFDPPSFLNPDTLTLLPEMTPEESAKLYTRPASVAGSRRSESHRSNSVFGRSRPQSSQGVYPTPREDWGYRKSRTDGFTEEGDDEVAELPAKRANTVLGHRVSASWDGGSSAGDGVLMESHGRTPERVSGYTYVFHDDQADRQQSFAPSRSIRSQRPDSIGLGDQCSSARSPAFDDGSHHPLPRRSAQRPHPAASARSTALSCRLYIPSETTSSCRLAGNLNPGICGGD